MRSLCYSRILLGHVTFRDQSDRRKIERFAIECRTAKTKGIKLAHITRKISPGANEAEARENSIDQVAIG